MESISERLESWHKKQSSNVALQIKRADAYERITFRELWELSRCIASELRNRGFRPGDHLSIYGENSPEWVACYLGIHFLGCVIIPLDSQLSPINLINIINFSDTKAVIADDDRLEQLGTVLSESNPEIRLISFDTLMKSPATADGFKPYSYSLNELQTIVFTSGTTGDPKGVMLTFGNVLGIIHAVAGFTKVSSRDNVLSILPLHHGYPCIVGLLSPLWAGATVTFSQSLKGTDLFATMRETGVTIFPGVPRILTLIDREIFSRVDSLPKALKLLFWIFYFVSRFFRKAMGIRFGKFLFKKIHNQFGQNLRFFASGGAKLDPLACEHFLNLGFLVVEGYGLTETSAASTLNALRNPKPGTAGIPLPGVNIRVDSPDRDGIGEICIQGHNVMKGYYKNEYATNEVLKDGWFHTGDLGMIDSRGSVIITGRAKEVIVLSSGKNIYPEEIEKLYENTQFAKELCVLPSLDEGGFTKGLKMVVVPDEKELDLRGVFNPRERIRSEIALKGASLPSYMAITELELYYGQFPRTMLGKIRRTQVENLIRQQKASVKAKEEEITLTPEERALMELPSSIRFLKRLREIADVKGPFTPSQELSIDLGLDSLTLVQIDALLENEFGVKIKEEELASVRTIGDILRRIGESDSKTDEEEIDISIKDLLEEPPTVPLDQMFNFKRGFVRRLTMRLIQFFVILLVKVVFRTSIEGLNKIPKKGAFLICPNHLSYIDPVVIFAILPGWLLDRLVLTGFSEFFKRAPLSWIVRPLRVILIGSTETFGDSLKLSYEALKRGMAVGIFPEGRRSPTGRLMPPRLGVGILSTEANVPIVPIFIEGAEKTLSPPHPGFRFAKVRVFFGDPLDPPQMGENPREIYQLTLERWTEAVLALEKKFKG